jgi:ABC-type nitrate/sulfonate/bicarbonate transport system substrate-binding protein
VEREAARGRRPDGAGRGGARAAACGGGDNGGGGGGSTQAAKPTTLNVGVIPIADVAPLYLGMKKGFFAQQKLTIKPKPAEGGAAITPVATYFTSRRYAEQNPDVVDRFVRAMNKSLDYAQSHPDEARAVLATYTPIPKAAAKAIKLPVWRSDLNTGTIKLLSRLSKKYGLIDKEPDLKTLIRSRG